MTEQSLSGSAHLTDVQQTGAARSACRPEQSWRDGRMEQDAIYFSRRAREERQAYLKGDCRRCRQIHLQLAEAYEFRAHLITREVRRFAADDLLAL